MLSDLQLSPFCHVLYHFSESPSLFDLFVHVCECFSLPVNTGASGHHPGRVSPKSQQRYDLGHGDIDILDANPRTGNWAPKMSLPLESVHRY
jgi:hypothetical protein